MSILELKLWKAAWSLSSLALGTLTDLEPFLLTSSITGPTVLLLTKTSAGKAFDFGNLSDILLLIYSISANIIY